MGADTTIATLRLRTKDADSPALRLRAARQLQAAALAPAGLAPAALLVVRRLSDPLPGRVAGVRLRPHPDWERAVRDELAALARKAERPDSRGRLPRDAQAILFGEPAEIVACLLADRARGEVPFHWWWRAVLPRLSLPRSLAGDPSRDPAPILVAQPRETPGAIHLLDRWGEASRVAAVMSPTGALQALAGLARAHGLPEEMVRPSGRATAFETASPLAAGWGAAAAGDPSAVSRFDGEGHSPWAEWAPLGLEEGRVPPAVHSLFALANSLSMAPGRVRSAAIVARARAWWAGVSEAGDRGARSVLVSATSAVADREASIEPARTSGPTADSGAQNAVAREGGTTPAERPDSRLRQLSPARRASATSAGEKAARPNAASVGSASSLAVTASAPASALSVADPAATRGSPGAAEAEPSPATAPLLAPAARPAGPSSHAGTVSATGCSVARIVSRRSLAAPEAPSAEEKALASTLTLGQGLVTRLGGLLFLIHALEDLGLPQGFDERWHAGEGGRWGVLDVLARALLGPRLAELRADPVWTALASLADWARRPRRCAAAAGTCDPPFRIPAPWLERLRDPLDELLWATGQGRVWIWSAAGYLVAHRRLRGDPKAALLRELQTLRPRGARPERIARASLARRPWTPPLAVPAGCPPRLSRWAAAVAPALYRRLALALGDADVIAHLMVPARLHLTSSHVDVVMGVCDADLAVRAAGLDRNPGWLPAYGRVVYFHFQ